ncbi:MAG: alpha-glucosidase C-terminal domain-containing protein [Ilumatobacteraceae bacterium]
MFSHYRRLIEFRHSEPAVASGSFEMLAPDHPTLFAYLRRLGDTELLVVANPSGTPLNLADLVDEGVVRRRHRAAFRVSQCGAVRLEARAVGGRVLRRTTALSEPGPVGRHPARARGVRSV